MYYKLVYNIGLYTSLYFYTLIYTFIKLYACNIIYII
nr:MAG TPA: hypothetical protein [Caudoviricetes sp.]